MARQKPEPIRTYTPGEVAEILKVHQYTVYKLLADGRLKGFRISNQWRITVEEVERFMNA